MLRALLMLLLMLTLPAWSEPDNEVREEYRRAAEQFAKVFRERPDHKLAGSSALAAGNNWLRARDYDKAAAMYRAVIAGADRYDHPIVAQAMYWLGDCLYKTKDIPAAQQVWRRLSGDYPDTRWAKYARRRLLDIEEEQAP